MTPSISNDNHCRPSGMHAAAYIFGCGVLVWISGLTWIAASNWTLAELALMAALIVVGLG